jgi:hypothetical protein
MALRASVVSTPGPAGRRTLLLLLALSLAGCARSRPARPLPDLLEARRQRDERLLADARVLFEKLVESAKARHDEHAAGRSARPAAIDILVISGGGDWGAFGAGFLKGWAKVPPGEMARPVFDVVTGVSTGALIAPFAFVGDAESIDLVVSLYRNPQKDWVKPRWPLYFLPARESFATVPGLEREVRARLTKEMLARIVEEDRKGRKLLVNTTDLDDGGMRVFDVGAEAASSAAEGGDAERVNKILLASAGIPAAFPFREIDDGLLVDGGVTGNILYGTRVKEADSIPALWAKKYPGLPVPRIRYWVIFNNQLRPLPQVTAPTWPAVVSRSLELGTRAATLMGMRHLHAQAEISRLKRGAEVEVRLVSIPDDWAPEKPGAFVKETMNALADLGERMGADPASWRTDPP